MFRAGLLLIIRRYYSVYTEIVIHVMRLPWLAVGRMGILLMMSSKPPRNM